MNIQGETSARCVEVAGMFAMLGLSFLSLGLLAGCPSHSTQQSSAPAPVAQAAAFGGTLYGGRQPITGASVVAWEAGAGAESPPTSIGTDTTDGNGQFSITFSPVPASGGIIYVTVTSGDATGGGFPNPDIAMATVAGFYCTSPGCGFPDFININELTTAAVAYSMAGFVDLTGGTVNIAGDSPGLQNAAKTFLHLVNAVTGRLAFQDPAACTGDGEPANCAALRKLDTLANVAAACVDSTDPGGSGGACDNFFTTTTPSGGTRPANTFAALLDIVTQYDVRNNATGIYALLSGNATIFSPVLATAPTAWALALRYTGGGINEPLAIAVDANGNVWSASGGNNSINKFSPTGQSLSPSGGYTGGGLDDPNDITISTDAVWTSSDSNNSINEFSFSGQALSPSGGYTGGSFPNGIAVDATGDLWIADWNGNSLIKFDPGTGDSSGYAGGGLSEPGDIAIDSSGNVWVASYGYFTSGSINEFLPSTGVFASGGGYTGGGVDSPDAIAIDADGYVWVASVIGSGATLFGSLNKFDPTTDTFLSGSGYIGGGLDFPEAIAIDAKGDVWAASSSSDSINEFDSSGQALSPDSGYIGGPSTVDFPDGIAVDESGNLWVSCFGTNSTVEFIGIAAPTRTPIISAITQGFTP